MNPSSLHIESLLYLFKNEFFLSELPPEALEILNNANSKAYHYALENLLKVKEIYEANGHSGTWSGLASVLQAKHKRKSKFIGSFNQIISGSEAPRNPTFMDRVEKYLKQ